MNDLLLPQDLKGNRNGANKHMKRRLRNAVPLIFICTIIGFVSYRIGLNNSEISVRVVETVEKYDNSVRLGSREGILILGMHRSGTSLLTGLLSRSGLHLGARLIQPKEENAKGYFEKELVVVQNDELLKDQNTHWCDGQIPFDVNKVLAHIHQGQLDFKKGYREIQDLESSPPWILKDPRMCITFRAWIPMFRTIPAVVFVYRHPVEVSQSLVARTATLGPKWKMKRALRLWMQYNKMAVTQSHDLCRVVTSNKHLIHDPVAESNRIIQELRNRCGVAIPHDLLEATVSDFFDVSLLHKSPGHDEFEDSRLGADCNIIEPIWELPSEPHLKIAELEAYQDAMKLYCALESGEAFDPNFKWPKIKLT